MNPARTHPAPLVRTATPTASAPGTVVASAPRVLTGAAHRAAIGLLLGAVALAFADASVVALALPELYVEFETSIPAVSWVLAVYALTAAVASLAGLRLLARTPGPLVAAAGSAVFAAASVAAGLAPSLPVLIVARGIQGIGAAALIGGAYSLLVGLAGEQRRAVTWWSAAGAAGVVLGPALGGFVTQAADWRAVFLLQAPVALGALGVAWVARGTQAGFTPAARRRSRGALVADGALALTFGALVGALFLGVILLVVVWGLSPAVGALVVTALPVGTLVARRIGDRLTLAGAAGAGGAVLAGGLAALALLPSVSLVWAGAALALCGLGFGLLAGALGPLAVPSTGGLRAATLSSGARHLGLVIGLAVIAPVLAADVTTAAAVAPLPATATMLDAPIGGIDKVRIALDIRDELADAPDGEVPDLDPVFLRNGAADDAGVAQLQSDLERSVQEVLTRSFRAAFTIAAVLAALAGIVGLAALALSTTPSRRPGSAGVWLSAALVVGSGIAPIGAVAAGAAEAGTMEITDPCTAAPDPYPGSGFDAAAQRMVLSGLNGAACELDVSREELVLSLEPRSGIDEVRWDPDTIESALRSGVGRAIDDAEDRGTVPGWIAAALGPIVDHAPISWFLDVVGVQ